MSRGTGTRIGVRNQITGPVGSIKKSATDCAGIRMGVRFEFHEGPLLLQLSDVPVDSIVLAITPAP